MTHHFFGIALIGYSKKCFNDSLSWIEFENFEQCHFVLFSSSKRPFYIILLNYAAQKWSTKIEHMIKGWNDVVKPRG